MKKIVASLVTAVSLCGLVNAAELDDALDAIDRANEMLQDRALPEVGHNYFGMIVGAVDDALQNHENDAKLNEFKEHFQAAKDMSLDYAEANEDVRPEMEGRLDEYKSEVSELRDYIEELKAANPEAEEE